MPDVQQCVHGSQSREQDRACHLLVSYMPLALSASKYRSGPRATDKFQTLTVFTGPASHHFIPESSDFPEGPTNHCGNQWRHRLYTFFSRWMPRSWEARCMTIQARPLA